jgi:Zn-dependent protease with chaperone function
MAHELGHAHFHHGLKVTLQASVLATVMFAWVGDVSVLLATLPAVALQARYSRAFEDEADRYSAQLLKANGIAPSRLAEMLEKLEAELRKSKRKGREGEEDEQSLGNFLASHPSTPARIARLRHMD